MLMWGSEGCGTLDGAMSYWDFTGGTSRMEKRLAEGRVKREGWEKAGDWTMGEATIIHEAVAWRSTMGSRGTEGLCSPVATKFHLLAEWNGTISVSSKVEDIKCYALLHYHPPQSISNSMRFVVNLVCRCRQIGLSTLQLFQTRTTQSVISGKVKR